MLTPTPRIACSLTFAAVSMGCAGHAAGDLAQALVVKDEQGRFWIEFEQQRLLSIGVNTVTPVAWNPREGTSYYDAISNQFEGDRGAWERSTEAILIDAGFNTLACWSDVAFDSVELLTTPILYVAGHDADRYLAGLDPAFEEQVRERTQAVLDSLARPDRVLGFYLDNEIAWWGRTGWDRIPNYTPLEAAFERTEEHPARQSALAFLEDRFETTAAFAEAFGVSLGTWADLDVSTLQQSRTPEANATRSAFIAYASEEYFRRSTRVVREMAPGALILGVRIAGDAPDEVIRACGRHCDIISMNHYRTDERSTREMVERTWLLGEKPIMVTEFSWRARENLSGNPNLRGAGGVLDTQSDRAAAYARFISDLASYPMIVGWSWFEWADQSPQGRFDGENSNYGLVSINHEPYQVLLDAMRQANREASVAHASTDRPYPTEMRSSRDVRYRPGQHPGRPPSVSLLENPAAPYDVWHAEDASIELTADDRTLVATYESGHRYGVGLSIRGPASSVLASGPEHATDLDGYERLVLEAEAPEGLLLQVIINEGGAADSNNTVFDDRGGDDGESYISPPVRGTGAPATYTFRIDEFLPQVYWGNQGGAREIEMRSVQSIAVQAQGEPREGTIRIRDLRLER